MSSNIETQVVLANAAQLALFIIKGAVGNAAADTIAGVRLTDDVLLSMIEARLQSNLSPHLEG